MTTKKALSFLGLSEVLVTPAGMSTTRHDRYIESGENEIIMWGRPQVTFRAQYLILDPAEGFDVSSVRVGANEQLVSSDRIPGEVFSLPRDIDRAKIDQMFKEGKMPAWLDLDQIAVRMMMDPCRPSCDLGLRVHLRYPLRGTQRIILRGAFLGEEIRE